jgi:hypothetical protein
MGGRLDGSVRNGEVALAQLTSSPPQRDSWRGQHQEEKAEEGTTEEDQCGCSTPCVYPGRMMGVGSMSRPAQLPVLHVFLLTKA